ncbi:hypothetical protein EG68_05964 [Paragonimus skrjabini miyazakii]|uniref:SET and MYND domain-containing protein 4 n=1 Tax=Paragonimus skrjabini miyazakii TaxID=59628 RepID=A0A8S9YU29_9TREM|nr:hypothetical protein EG68_05964 [Paragonimus skrjabini miyazakii]
MGPKNTTLRVPPELTHYPSEAPRHQSNAMSETPMKLAPVGMIRPRLHQDFQRFCQLAATVVMETWNTTEESNECETTSEPCLWPAEFARCMTDFERVSVLMRHSTIRQFNLLPADQTPDCRSSLKCDSKSDELRDQGNCAWQRRQIPQALSHYTKAIFYAASSERRALALVNRSCVLAHVGAHQAVLDDTAYARTEFFETRNVIRGLSDLRHVNSLVDRGVERCDSLSRAARSAIELTGRCGERNPSLHVHHPDPPALVPGSLVTGADQRLECQHPWMTNCLSVGWLPTRPKLHDVSLLWQNTVAAVFLTHCLKAGGYRLDWDDNCLLNPSGDTLLVDEQPLPTSWTAACMLQQLLALSYAGQDVTCTTYVNRNSDVPDIPEVIWDRIQVDKLGKALYPIIGLRTVSCDSNTHTVHMADGVCALFTLKPIKCGELFSRTRSGQFVEYDRMESQNRLRCNYLIEDCRCVICRENWSTESPSPMFCCPQCQDIIPLIVTDSGDLSSEKSCSCPHADLSSILQRYSKSVQEAEEELIRIPFYYQCLVFHQFPRQLLDKHISFLVRMLGSDELNGVLVRPSQSLCKLQNLLRQLLALRHGCCVTETDLVRTNNEELDCSNCLIS